MPRVQWGRVTGESTTRLPSEARYAPQPPPEFRRLILDLVASDRKIAEVATLLGISEQTIHIWRRQSLIGTGQMPGTPSHRLPKKRSEGIRVMASEGHSAQWACRALHVTAVRHPSADCLEMSNGFPGAFDSFTRILPGNPQLTE
ncbi:helix-turn-helix domain-containing protein [Streptomyces sp. NPDC047061]|uniref:helix-turn-helix domain-containing protein n=1 Tax=Streptomyces sp. NPDC047061 TaxID=3154605 RepID=UPI0033F41ECA